MQSLPAKQRMTRQRAVILEELRGMPHHPTADELYEAVRRRLPRVSLGTIYRNLDLLARGGAIRKLDMGGSQSRFDGETHDHCHVRCVGCGRIDDVPGRPIERIAMPERSANAYRIMGYRLEFDGLCPDCAEEEDAG